MTNTELDEVVKYLDDVRATWQISQIAEYLTYTTTDDQCQANNLAYGIWCLSRE